MSDKYPQTPPNRGISGNKKVNLNASLNEAAALFMQIKPDDLFELSLFQELLYKIAFDESYPEISRKKILQAARKIEGIIDVYRALLPLTQLPQNQTGRVKSVT